MNSVRYKFILDAIKRMIGENPYYSSEEIMEILKVISKHRKLQNKLLIIIKGEKFKVFAFIIMLPIIIGAIGGMIPIIFSISRNLNFKNEISFSDYIFSTNIYEVIIICLTFLLINTITSNFFLNIINFEKKKIIIFFSNLIYLSVFLLSFNNIILLF